MWKGRWETGGESLVQHPKKSGQQNVEEEEEEELASWHFIREKSSSEIIERETRGDGQTRPFFSYLITRCGPYLEPRSYCLSISFWCCRQIRPVASAAAAWTLTSPTVHSVEENCLLSTFAGQSLSVLTRPIPRILLYGIISLEKINTNQEDALRKHHARYTAVLEIILAAENGI